MRERPERHGQLASAAQVPDPRRQYRYPDSFDRVPEAAIRPTGVRGGARWEDSDAEILREVAALLPNGRPRRIVDVGAGTGRLIPIAARLGGTVVAVEPDHARIVMAKERAAAAGYRNCSFVENDLLGFSSTGGRFDLVICSHVIQHLASTERRAFIAALRAVTDPAGLLLLTFPVTTASQDRHMVSAVASADGAVRTSEVGAERFDAAAKRLLPRPPAETWLPVWHARRGQVEQQLQLGHFDVLRQFDYRQFAFELVSDESAATAETVRAADMCVIARLTPEIRA
jgi:SAM-dependent methyltransferase